MRLSVLAFAAIWLFAASQASAAPACWARNGDPARCGAPGAMPVGWSPPQDELRRREEAAPPEIDNLLKAGCVIGVLLCVIALMPQFDGTRNEDWEQKDK